MVKKYDNGIDWNEVAKDSNGRTAYDCFRRYQEKFNIENRKFGWSNEDNVLLLSLIGSFNAENMSDIYWEEVRRNFPGKSKSQIYAYVGRLFQAHIKFIDNHLLLLTTGTSGIISTRWIPLRSLPMKILPFWKALKWDMIFPPYHWSLVGEAYPKFDIDTELFKRK